MRSLCCFILWVGLSWPCFAQQHQADFELGNGLTFSLNEGDYEFNMGGMFQALVGYEQLPDEGHDLFFSPQRSYFHISGKAVNEKVSFFLQTDFSRPDLLLDAWVKYAPVKGLTITAGQMQTIANNREMLLMEDQLSMITRSLLSTVYSNRGREFGLFIAYSIGGDKFLLVPEVAITSGDGINSFGADSRDPDIGGVKYAGRLTIYPFGPFTPGNEGVITDLAHESKLKVALGGAASYNNGASEAVGEGHGRFMWYNAEGNTFYPDYRQWYIDLVAKYKGLSLLVEYGMATATDLNGSFINEAASIPLIPTQVSEYLALGSGMNAQFGYVTRSGWGADVRYAMVTPEFDVNPLSIVEETTAYSLGLARYVKGNALKIQAEATLTTIGDGESLLSGGLVVQLRL